MIHRLSVTPETVLESTLGNLALGATLVAFLKRYPQHEKLTLSDISLDLEWQEHFAPLDMDKNAQERAEQRFQTVSDVHLTMRVGEDFAKGPNIPPKVLSVVWDYYMNWEKNR
jgi:hypothetical protein